MTIQTRAAAIVLGMLALGFPLAAGAYPGGTPNFQTDAAPYCAGCHSSRQEFAFSGAAPGMAAKQLVENKHLAVIRAGKGGYGDLTAEQREELVGHIQALDAASTVQLNVIPKAKPGEVITVTVDVTGGAGPVVGIALVDRPHRALARPIAGSGWQVVGEPTVLGQDFKEQTEWLHLRPADAMRNLSFVNVKGIRSDAAAGEWGRAQVVWKLRAPTTPGTYPLVASYWYGSEKASPLGIIDDPILGKMLRGGFAGGSGRILFSDVIGVKVR
ncbi:MAG: hypothetical protein JRH01_02875 [Deltaproteobacteria bacterium]|nr:hypothetical protein [Deltaproteobacteria bacterium]MBW2393811.1 hypothetical protein [Deltaproteobacteria bacterium]